MKRPSLAPKYMVFIGDGSFDYKDYQGFGDSLVPPLMVDTPDGLAPSDNLLADLVGNDGVPEVAIGRIPALSGAEVTDALSEDPGLRECLHGQLEQVGAASPPTTRIPMPATSRPTVMRMAALLPGSFDVTKVYLDDDDLLTARGKLLPGFVDTLWINYIGHSGIDNWAQRGPARGRRRHRSWREPAPAVRDGTHLRGRAVRSARRRTA